jgi:two-component system CheB/CheR fusion protein
LDHPLVSRRHCRFFVDEDQIWVEDLGSLNGTCLNGETLRGTEPIRDGDCLAVAQLPFRVCLGAATPRSPQEAAPPSATLAAEQPQQVLVVEDDEATAETLAGLLRQWGHEVQVAHDGVAALQAAQTQPPDTVLLDLRLPGMDGYQVAEQLRRQAGMERARLVAITGYGPEEERGRSHRLGIHRVLVKPIDPVQLQDLFHAAEED